MPSKTPYLIDYAQMEITAKKYEPTPAQLDWNNRAFGARLSTGRRNMERICKRIRKELEVYNVELPQYERDYRQMIDRVYMVEDFGDELKDKFGPLVKVLYNLERPRHSIGTAHINPTNLTIQTRTLGHEYTKNRLDPIYQVTKVKQTRKVYLPFIEKETGPGGHLFGCQPVHLVLTVPHAKGKYKGQSYYGDLLLKEFNHFRKNPGWKDRVVGGFYALEVSGSKENGLHIHLHVAVWLNHWCKVNDFRQYIADGWGRVTGGAKCVWVESMYYYERDADGNFITRPKSVAKIKNGLANEVEFTGDYYQDGEEIPIPKGYERVKKYITPNSPVEEYYYAVLECLKYTFKPDAIFNHQNFDLELVALVAKGSLRKRHYSRIGSFTKYPQLRLNNKDDNTNGVTDTEGEETTGGKLANSMRQAVHPATLEVYDASELQHVVLFRPEQLWYINNTGIIKAKQKRGLLPIGGKEPTPNPEKQNQSYEVYKGQYTLVDNNPSQIVKALVTNRKERLVGADHERFNMLFGIAHRLQRIITHQRFDDYANYWRNLPGFYQLYNDTKRDALGQLELAIEAMRAYCNERLKIATAIKENEAKQLILLVENYDYKMNYKAA